MIRILLILVMLLAPSVALAADPASLLQERLPATGAPGAAFASLSGGEIEAGAAGVTRKGGDQPVTADTLFPIGSVTKSFTAVAILQLDEAEALAIDDPLSAHLPAFAGRPAARITLRQLMSHTSGYSTVQGNLQHADGPDAETDEIVRLAGLDPAYASGERWEYSNANYVLLGAVIEAVSGESYDQFVTRNILTPLGISNQAGAAEVTAHTPWFGSKRAFDSDESDKTMLAAGGLWLSADDLAAYLAMLMNGEQDLLTPESKALMMRPASEASPHYGLGWFIDDEAGTVYHSGLVPGAEALVTMRPAERRGAVVLVNANSGIGIAYNYNLTAPVTAAALGLDPPAPASDWGMKLTYFSIVALPLFYLAAMLWAFTHRPALTSKRESKEGLFSLWFPLVTTSAVSVVLLVVVPPLFGGSMGTLHLYQPDFAIAMTAAAILGPAWALVRLGLAYVGKASSAHS